MFERVQNSGQLQPTQLISLWESGDSLAIVDDSCHPELDSIGPSQGLLENILEQRIS